MENYQAKLGLIETKTATGTYIHSPDRDLEADLKKAQRKHSISLKGGFYADSIDRLAKRTAEFMEATDKKFIHVFPVLPSGRGASADFRRHLAAELTGRNSEGRGDYFAHTLDQVRIRLEKAAFEQGYRFIEVDPDDY